FEPVLEDERGLPRFDPVGEALANGCAARCRQALGAHDRLLGRVVPVGDRLELLDGSPETVEQERVTQSGRPAKNEVDGQILHAEMVGTDVGGGRDEQQTALAPHLQ
ncbi:hypothetical protein RZS08_59555, partial [Arthrospira platensis SPKY1]|nr:hypothetical protein [Arthrospira platensis SPKY1]